jgi:Na+/H+-dicarboxylate symporter
MRSTLIKVLSNLKHRGVQTLLLLTLYFFTANHLPLIVHQGLYTISFLIKDILMWVLPITVGFFIAHTLCSFQKKAPLFIFTLIIFEGLSNLCSIWYAFGCAHLISDSLPPLQSMSIQVEMQELWRLPFIKPSWWSANKGTLLGLILGCLGALTKNAFLNTWIFNGSKTVQWILTKIIAPLIPLFVLGFFAKIHYTNLFHHLLKTSSKLALYLTLVLILYLFFLFFISSFSFTKTLQNLRNLLPAGGVAFLSGCSLSTMPWTIEGSSKNLDNKALAQAIIPATTNIQQIGDCIAQAFLCFIIYTCFYRHPPSLSIWITFSLVFTLARFATAGILGGAIFIMLPIYENYLYFNAEMISVVLAFNTLLDPLITSANVIANGALCRLFEKIWIPILRVHTLFIRKSP